MNSEIDVFFIWFLFMLVLVIECFLLLLRLLLTVVFKKVHHYCIDNSDVYVYSINKNIGTASNKFAH